MLQFAHRLSSIAESVRFEVPALLYPILPYFNGISDVEMITPVAQERANLVELESLELPYALRLTCDALPFTQQYLHLPESVIDSAAKYMGAKSLPRIGFN